MEARRPVRRLLRYPGEKLMVTKVVTVEVVGLRIYFKVEPKQLGVVMKERTQNFGPVLKESYLLHSSVRDI